MAHETESRILALHLGSVEARAVRIDPRAEIGVTLHAVGLLVARRASVEILSSGAPML
jgi:hypothetical protein